MKRIDHVRKTVYTIVGCLIIISLVLTICHKVGHCASDSSNSYPITDFPLPFGSGYGYTSEVPITDTICSQVLNLANTFSSNYYGYDTLVFSEYNSTSNSVFFYAIQWNLVSIVPSSNGAIFPNYTYSYVATANNNKYCAFEYDFDDSQIQFRGTGSSLSVGISNYLLGSPSGVGYMLKDDNLYLYPVYTIFEGSSFTDYFSEPSPSFSGHTKGGVLVNYIDSDDLIEQDSSLPTVDTSAPADPSSNSGWFQKILNGLSKINQSIKGGVLTIGDYIGQGFENIINWLTEPFDQEAFSDELDEVFLLSDILGAKDLIDQSGIFDWEDITPSQSVSWTFDFGGAVLPHTSCTIDFSWYTGTVKNLIVTLICTFLVVGLLATLFNSIPSIISGHSGDKGGGSDS